MYKLCKTEQSARRQRQLEEALLEIMQTRQYDEISVSDLCAQLGIPRKAFYRYFSSKEGALLALVDHRLLEYENYGDTKPDTWKHGFPIDLDWFFTFWVEQKKLLDALARSGLSGILVERAIRNSQEARIFEYQGVSREYLNASTAFTVCGLMSMVLRWHHDGYAQNPGEMAEMARKLLGHPLVPGIDG